MKFKNRGERVLDEINPHLAPVNALTKPANRQRRVRKQTGVARLDNQPIKETIAVRDRVEVSTVSLRIINSAREFEGGSHTFKIQGSGIAGRVRLMIVDEAARLLLLIT